MGQSSGLLAQNRVLGSSMARNGGLSNQSNLQNQQNVHSPTNTGNVMFSPDTVQSAATQLIQSQIIQNQILNQYNLLRQMSLATGLGPNPGLIGQDGTTPKNLDDEDEEVVVIDEDEVPAKKLKTSLDDKTSKDVKKRNSSSSDIESGAHSGNGSENQLNCKL